MTVSDGHVCIVDSLKLSEINAILNYISAQISLMLKGVFDMKAFKVF